MPEENQRGTLEAIGVEMAKLFLPFQERVEAGEILLLFQELGVDLPGDLETYIPFTDAVSEASDKVAEMIPLVKAIIDAVKAEDYTLTAEKVIALIGVIAELVEYIQAIVQAIDDHKTANPGDYTGFDASVLADLAKNVVDYLVINYLQNTIQVLALFLEFFGIINEETFNEGTADEYTRKTLELSNVPKLLTNPAGLAGELYGWGLDGFDGESLFIILEKILLSIGWPAVYSDDDGHQLDLFIANVEAADYGSNHTGLIFTLGSALGGSFSQSFEQDKWTLDVDFDVALQSDAGVVIKSDGDFDIQKPTTEGTEADLSASVRWTAKDNVDGLPLILFGERTGSRLQADEISAFLGGDFVWNIPVGDTPGTFTGNITFEAEIKDGLLVIKPSNPDGFLAKILPPDGFTLDFDVLLGISSEKGLYFRGSGTLEFNFPVAISLGPIEIQNLTLALVLGDEFKINLGADIKAELGPFTAVVENMGMSTVLTFPEERNGNLGPVNMAFNFKPPNGIGLSLDAGAVKGGGYLLLDYDAGMYAGAIELEFEGLFGFTAIGIVNTKFPDGSKGFSLLLLVNVTFGTPIALGFNFFLAGIGGIIGLHRTMSSEALQKGVKDGSISNIMFPENAVANINKIISDMQAIFPIKQDQFVLGLMAKITWNTPAVLTIEAGLIIEFPNPVKIAIIGVIRCLLPTPDKAIIKLNVAFVGIIDFGKKLLSFDASIFDSKILTITLEGDMALRMSWGEKKDFLVSIGGFHPSYTAPAYLELLPMKRITVSIFSGNPNLVLTAYFALTTNTIQFGAALDFSFTISKFGIYGKLGFDVLIQFSPFRFIAGIHASVEVRLGSSVLFSIGLEFNLEGPAPWRAFGYAKFKILFISFKVKFDKTWGEEKVNSLPSTAVLPLLQEELAKDANWNSVSAGEKEELVTYASIPSTEDIVLVKPFGSLEVNQAVVPLDLSMSKFGNYLPDDISKATITTFTLDPSGNPEVFTSSSLEDLQNSFAPSAYKEMADADKLKAPSYNDENSGIRLASTDDIVFDYGINRIVEYEVILSDYEEVPLPDRMQFSGDMFRPFVAGGAVGKSRLSKKKKQAKERTDKFVQFESESYAVVNASDMTNFAGADGPVFASKSAADEYLRSVLKDDPSQSGKIQLTPSFQMA